MPSIPGIVTSSVTRSGSLRRTVSTASSPLAAVSTARPARRSTTPITSRWSGSSSTTSTRRRIRRGSALRAWPPWLLGRGVEVMCP